VAYVTLAELKSLLGSSSTDAGGTTDNDALLTNLIDYAQQIIETETGRVFQVASDTAATAHKFDAETAVLGNTLFVDADMGDVASDMTVVDGTITITDTNFVLEPANGPPYYGIRLKSSSSDAWGNTDSDGNYEQAISVTASWCYGSLPNDIKYACLRLARWLFKQRNDDTAITTPIITASGATLMPVDMPRDVAAILARYKRVIFA
jgi:hypothetical protein